MFETVSKNKQSVNKSPKTTAMLHLVPLRTACSELLCDVRVAAMLKLAELLRGPAVFDGPDFGLFLSREP